MRLAFAIAFVIGCHPAPAPEPAPAPAPAPEPAPAPNTGSGSGTTTTTTTGGAECPKEKCGPALGMKSTPCSDGSIGGPTGRCLERADKTCGWEIRACP
jgi:hypothetical protein